MAFTPTEEAQLRAVIDCIESGKTISEIAASTEVFPTDALEIIQEAVSKKATVAQIVTLVNSELGISAMSTKLSGIETGAQVNVIESIVAGTNVNIDITDPKKPVINVPELGSSTETAPYVLSGLDADIKTGVIASHTILEKHQFTAADIYAEVTTMPEVLGIVVDVLKNGVSIFSTKPSIAAGALHSVGTHVLVTSPTVFNVGDIRSISVDQMGVGDGKTGKNLKLSILMHKII